jgi:DNA repair protein REV1
MNNDDSRNIPWNSRQHYDVVKQSRLREQHATGVEQISSLFEGITFHIDGYTQPTNTELIHLMFSHGGKYEQYFSRSLVTHVICINLSHSKIKEYKAMSEKTRPHVIKPEWILDSIKHNTLQNLKPYELLDFGKQSTFVVQKQQQNTNNNHYLQNAATDPNYVKNFLKNSRLHFIGSWRRKFIERNEYTLKKYKKFKKQKKDYFVVHLDMDCFFAAIAMRENPELRTKPMAVSHSSNGNGDVSSANYVAREYGVRSGMWMAQAKQLCPELIVVPYQFDLYEEAAIQVYEVIKSFVETDSIEVSSIDEVYLYLYHSDTNEISDLVSNIRKVIEQKTNGCTASAGISTNKLLARMATKKAKPNGQLLISENGEEVMSFMKSFKLRDIPGVGRKLSAKIEQELNAVTVEQLLPHDKTKLQELFGDKRGEMLYHYSRGEETEEDYLSQEDYWIKKSRTVDINYGIRFERVEQVHEFITKICEEMSERMQLENIRSKCLTLKIKKRSVDAPKEPAKFNGMGRVDAFTKNCTLPDYTNRTEMLASHAKKLYDQMNIEPEELRGIGIQVSKLMKDSKDKSTSRISQFFTKNNNVEAAMDIDNGPNETTPNNIAERVPANIESEAVGISLSALPSMSQLDANIFEALPMDIKNELIHAYATRYPAVPNGEVPLAPPKPVPSKKRKAKSKLKGPDPKQKKLSHYSAITSKPKANSVVPEAISTQNVANGEFSQVNYEVLKELPTQIRKEVLEEIQEDKIKKQKLIVPVTTLSTTQPIVIADEESEQIVANGRLFVTNTIDEVKLLLREWIESLPHVLEHTAEEYYEQLVSMEAHVQIEVLLQYIDQMICIEKTLDQVVLLLRFLRRLFEREIHRRDDSLLFKWIFNDILLGTTQQIVLERYKAQLLLIQPIQ